MTIQDAENIFAITIELQDFPVPGKEMVVPNEDGSYTVFLNSRLNWESQMIFMPSSTSQGMILKKKMYRKLKLWHMLE